jgi:hypothetical protein
MVRSAAKQRVSNHGAVSSFETHRFAMLLRMKRREAFVHEYRTFGGDDSIVAPYTRGGRHRSWNRSRYLVILAPWAPGARRLQVKVTPHFAVRD